MYWELWDVESRNLVEDFATEEEALQAILEILAVNRPDYVDDLALAAMYDEGEPREAELPPALRGEALRARLAEIAQDAAADTAREVHERIMKWLDEERWDVRTVDDPQSSFNVMATLPSGPNINIFQYRHHIDHLTLSQHWLYDDRFRSAIGELPRDTMRNLVWNIYHDVSLMGAEFSGLDTPSTEMTIRAYIYFDGLTKDAFIQKALLTIRALSLAVRTFIYALEDRSHSEELDPSSGILTFIRALEEDSPPEETGLLSGDVAPASENRVLSPEELRALIHVLPATEGPLTIAG